MRLRIMLSSGALLAVPFSRIHGCCNTWSAFARRFGSCKTTSTAFANTLSTSGLAAALCLAPDTSRCQRYAKLYQLNIPFHGSQGSSKRVCMIVIAQAIVMCTTWSNWCHTLGQRLTGTSNMRTQSFASLLMRGQGSDWKSSCPFRMESKICCSVSPQNGGTPGQQDVQDDACAP